MMIFITERQICYQLHRMRWKDRGQNYQLSDWQNWNKGVRESDFENYLFNQEFRGNGLKYAFVFLYAKLRPRYLKTFYARIKEAINHSIEAGLIQRKVLNEGNRLVLTREGKKLISSFYFPKKIFSIFEVLSRIGRGQKV